MTSLCHHCFQRFSSCVVSWVCALGYHHSVISVESVSSFGLAGFLAVLAAPVLESLGGTDLIYGIALLTGTGCLVLLSIVVQFWKQVINLPLVLSLLHFGTISSFCTISLQVTAINLLNWPLHHSGKIRAVLFTTNALAKAFYVFIFEEEVGRDLSKFFLVTAVLFLCMVVLCSVFVRPISRSPDQGFTLLVSENDTSEAFTHLPSRELAQATCVDKAGSNSGLETDDIAKELIPNSNSHSASLNTMCQTNCSHTIEPTLKKMINSNEYLSNCDPKSPKKRLLRSWSHPGNCYGQNPSTKCLPSLDEPSTFYCGKSSKACLDLCSNTEQQSPNSEQDSFRNSNSLLALCSEKSLENSCVDNWTESTDDMDHAKRLLTLVRNPTFHLVMWPGALFHGCCVTLLNNISTFNTSLRTAIPDDLAIVVLSVSNSFARLLSGWIVDMNAMDKNHHRRISFQISVNLIFVCSTGMYLTFFDKESTLVCALVIVGLSVGSALIIPISTLVHQYGRSYYTVIVCCYNVVLISAICFLQAMVGVIYDNLATDKAKKYDKFKATTSLLLIISFSLLTITPHVLNLVYRPFKQMITQA